MSIFVLCLLMTLALGMPLIRALRALSYKQHAYEDAPKSHAVKTGTPTMGGVLFVLALAVVALWHHEKSVMALAGLGLLCAGVGAIDDAAKIRGARNKGLGARAKFLLTVLAGLLFLAFIGLDGSLRENVGVVMRWWNGGHGQAPPVLWYALGLLVILATTHALNLTDGLDGLAAGSIAPPLALFAWTAWRLGEPGVTFVDLGLLGAVIGFLAFNRYPAKVFMGDTGALLLGGVLGGSAVLTGTIFLLPLVGGVFVAETLSVIMQVAYFKRTGKRIFRMSPLHHHFELGGWSETTVTQRFWLASALLTLVGAVIVR